MTRSKLFLLAATCVATLSSCGDSDSSTAPSSTPVPFATAAVGTWTAQKQDTIKVPFLVDSLELFPIIEVINTLGPDGSFKGQMFLRDIINGNGVDSALYQASGTWLVEGDSILIIRPSSCMQAVMKATSFGTLPFSAPPELKANELAEVPCSAPDTVRVKPSGNTWVIPLEVNMPAPIGAGTWLLPFTR